MIQQVRLSVVVVALGTFPTNMCLCVRLTAGKYETFATIVAVFWNLGRV